VSEWSHRTLILEKKYRELVELEEEVVEPKVSLEDLIKVENSLLQDAQLVKSSLLQEAQLGIVRCLLYSPR